MAEELHVVTGAFGYSGKYIAARLLSAGCRVRTLTNSPRRANLFDEHIEVAPFNFDRPRELAASLQGADVLYNTYWVRFNHRDFKYAIAVENTLRLFEAAKAAGVRRVVHVSITNPSEDSPLEYFRDKAQLERALAGSGLSHAILRPAVLFGKEGILINNIAWMLRRLPMFGVFGNGEYRLQPIYVDDLARIAVVQGRATGDVIVNATGPETFTDRRLVGVIGEIVGKPRPVISVPPALGYLVAWLVGKLVDDVVVTRDEIEGLMANLLYVPGPPVGTTKLKDWARDHAASLGQRYASELARRRDRQSPYESL